MAVAASADPVLFYGGDFDSRDGGYSGQNGSVADSRIYDDFTLSSASNITGIFANFLDSMSIAPTTAYYEFRSGVSAGNGGTLIASGTMNVTGTPTGRSGFGLNEIDYAGSITPVMLSAGTYWVTMAPISAGTGSEYMSTTSGANGVGGPLANGNSFWDSPTFGLSFANTSDVFGAGTWDMSIGVTGTPVPEPASMAVLGLGALALIRRRRSKKA
ncbi:MAG TPA: PEP-CTERM sorting domain-containing protein [Fimbriimonadaceae bacterium]|nr:PEP-CTERM sorting domain-containing protein [Fimbriimonadaceae bacterium]